MNYAPAMQIALEKFRACSLEDIRHFSRYIIKESCLQINFLGQHYEVDCPSGNFRPEASLQGELPVFARILILHYLTNTVDTIIEGKYISFKELPGGHIYIQPFTNRSILPLAKLFGAQPHRLVEIASRLGGRQTDLGDVGVTINVFPRIPITLVLWQGDEEFAASANILFDASAAQLLPTEDYAVLAGFIVASLKCLLNQRI
ncbi:MAG TPA: DUF3786 domain-containing protein [Desulfitobacteriaceae bacterium]|nr:DUF3786 domain-containing protein [Desulfitobacteriaceae bacterium]